MNEKKISLTTAILLFIIFILIMAIVGGIVYFVNYKEENDKKVTGREYNNVINNDKPNTDTNTSLNFNINENAISENNTNSNLHLDLSLTGESNYLNKSVSELVTDAEFDYNTGIDSFTYNLYNWSTHKEDKYTYEANSTKIGEVDLKTSKFPYVNIDSAYGRKVNDEIEMLFNKYFENYKNAIQKIKETEYIQDVEEKIGSRGEISGVFENNKVSYSAYKNDNILSIVIKETLFIGLGNKYTTYNIDLNTGLEAKFNDTLLALNLDTTKGYKKACEEMEKVLKEEFIDYPNDAESVKEYNDYVKKNEEKLTRDLFNSTKFFIDGNGKLNVICTIFHKAGKDIQECILPVQ